MRVGNLIKFTHVSKKPEKDDIGVIIKVDDTTGRVDIWWAKTGNATSKVDKMLEHSDCFEVINASR